MKNPNDLLVGSGQAAQGSVSTSALVTVDFAARPPVSVNADAIPVDTPLAISGSNVQLHVDGVSGLAPRPLPLTLGQVYQVDPEVGFVPTPSLGSPAGSNILCLVFPSASFQYLNVGFPADRGVLAVEFDPTLTGLNYQAVSALDMTKVFVEGSPDDDVTAPSRRVGQLDYIAGSDPAASVGVLPQNVTLRDRLPRLDDYTRSNFPFLNPVGDDPVYPAFHEDFTGQYLSKFEITVNLSVGQNGLMRFVHYKSRVDFQAGQAGDPFASWSIVDTTFAPLNISIFFDNSVIPVGITSYTLDANNLVDSNEIGPSRRFLSGVLYYSPVDTFTLTWGATGMYANSYALEGAALPRGPLDTADESLFGFSSYSPPVPNIADVSTFNDPLFTFAVGGVRAARPLLRVFKPNGSQNTQPYPALHPTLLVHEANFLTIHAQEENFRHERSRYPFTGNAILAYDPSGTTSTWDATASIVGSQELQVRGVDVVTRPYLGLGGGELVFPVTDYSTGHVPQTFDGVTPQRDYSVVPGFPFLVFVRAFDVGGPRREGRIQIDGTFDTGLHATLAAMLLEPNTSGVDIELAATGAQGVFFSSVLRPVGQGGILTGVEIVSETSVILDYLLPHTPNFQFNAWPVTCQVKIQTGSQASLAPFGLQRIRIVV
jgi:hypothetical protein